MSRYPYTEAADALRVTVPNFEDGISTLSRSHASMIRQYIANAIGMDDHDLACRIADYARAQEQKA